MESLQASRTTDTVYINKRYRDTRYFCLEYTDNIWIKDTSGDFGFGPLKIRDLVSPLRKQWSQEFQVGTFNSSVLFSFTVL